eukprot:10223515-Lingulodinium_polyedra.AAC.1
MFTPSDDEHPRSRSPRPRAQPPGHPINASVGHFVASAASDGHAVSLATTPDKDWAELLRDL